LKEKRGVRLDTTCRRKKEKSKEKDNLVLGYSGMIDELAI